MATDNNRLQGIELVKLEEGDAHLENRYAWEDRKKAHDALKDSNLLENKPGHPVFFEFEKTSAAGKLRCNLVIPIVKIRATIPGQHSNGEAFNTDEEFTWAMDEAAEWSKKQLFYEEVKLKGNATSVKYASEPDSY